MLRLQRYKNHGLGPISLISPIPPRLILLSISRSFTPVALLVICHVFAIISNCVEGLLLIWERNLGHEGRSSQDRIALHVLNCE